jgi:TatA/E family protein of Tat protein translocase
VGNLGFSEMAVIFVVALLVFGPHKLPELARSLGKSLAEFRRASNDLRRTIMEADLPEQPPQPPRGPADEVVAAVLPSPPAVAPLAPAQKPEAPDATSESAKAREPIA